MRIVPGTSGLEAPATAATSETARVDGAASTTATSSASPSEPMQSAVLQPAIDALRELPDIDYAKVLALREQLAKGELPFDAGKLAALIESYHRSGQ